MRRRARLGQTDWRNPRVSDGGRREKVWMVDGRGVRNACRASGDHGDGPVARIWPQHFFGVAVACVTVIGWGRCTVS